MAVHAPRAVIFVRNGFSLVFQSSWQSALASVVRQRPLFETRSSLDALARCGHLHPPSTVSVGLGLCSASRHVSRGVPIDLVGMLASAEVSRRATGAQRLVVLIADVHAERAGVPRADVMRHAARLSRTVRQIAQRCAIPAELISGYDLYDTSAHREARAELARSATHDDDYLSLETSDTEALRRRYGRLLKLGWSLGGAAADVHDERYFDDHYRRSMGEDVAFAYVRAGQTLSPERPRAAPYVVTRPDHRVLIDAEEDPTAKLELARACLRTDRFRGLVRYYGHVAASYGELATPLRGTPATKLRNLIGELCSAEDSNPSQHLTRAEEPREVAE